MTAIDITVHDSELAMVLAMAGIPLHYIEDSEDGPELAASLDHHEAQRAVAALLRIVGTNPRLAPDLMSAIGHLLEWGRRAR